jgi:hypothetical protein
MAIEVKSPAELAKARDYEKERAAIREKLSATTDEKVIRDLNQQTAQINADEENSKRTGVGKRVMVGQTRGKNPQIITWEAFADELPDTHPKSVDEFTNVVGEKSEAELVQRLIIGENELAYIAASDPIKEYVEPTWDDDVQTNFRLVVRNYARTLMLGIDEAVALIKPGFVKQFGPK